jgi:tetratricopeptide (TPR) repeat protein
MNMSILKRIFHVFFALAICHTANAQFQKADKEYELHAYNLAIPSYLMVLGSRPDNVQAVGRLADCYRMLNQMEEAAKWYQKAVGMQGVDKERILEYGHVLKALGRYDDAQKQYYVYANTNPVAGNHFAQSCNFAKAQQGVSASFILSNEFINTSASEFGPSFSGSQVVFSSARTDIRRSSSNWTGKANNQLFMASVGSQGYLESPVFLKNVEVGEFNDGPVSFSPDGKLVAFTKNSFVDGTRQIPESGMELSIHIAQINPSGAWVDAKPFPHNGTQYATGFPCFSPDGMSLYFASDRPDGFGGFDIYVSHLKGSIWTAPENLGPVINSPGNEMTPFFDGAMLYFSSDWHHGLGGFDIFRAEQSNGRWTRIFHLGNTVNSSRDDYGFVYDSFRNLGYLVSNRPGGRGNEDIYRVYRSADNIELRVKNASDGSSIPYADIDFTNCGERIYKTDDRGHYSFQAVQGLNCNLVVRKEGYVDYVFQISTLGLNRRQEYDIPLSRIGEQYAGKVLNSANRAPVAGVTITATNQATGSSIEASTDAYGDYTLALSPKSTYVLRFSRPGFRDVNMTVRTEDGLDRTILGIISLLSSTSSSGEVGAGVGEPSSVEPLEPAIDRGFAVQVAAIGTPSLDRFDDLRNLGSVYYKTAGATYKIRVGVFNSRSDAENALRQIKAKGYQGAFIVQEEGSDTGVKGAPQTQPSTAGFGQYKVQLAAYRDTRWFDETRVRDLGVIEEKQRDGLTVKYIAGFTSVNEAREALRKAKAAGFDSAFIVLEENGQLRKIN